MSKTPPSLNTSSLPSSSTPLPYSNSNSTPLTQCLRIESSFSCYNLVAINNMPFLHRSEASLHMSCGQVLYTTIIEQCYSILLITSYCTDLLHNDYIPAQVPHKHHTSTTQVPHKNHTNTTQIPESINLYPA